MCDIQKISNITACMWASFVGFLRRLFSLRRSRTYWPTFDDAQLWYQEEVYEYKTTGGIDELMDVIGTIFILETVHNHPTPRIKINDVDDTEFVQAVIRWWMRQERRGRPNESLDFTIATFTKIKNGMITI